MATYLLTWNPTKFLWNDLQDDIRLCRAQGWLDGTWSCGNTRRIQAGDRLFLLRQGPKKRGIVAAGWARGPVEEGSHWEDESTSARYVPIRFDSIFDAEKEAIFPREALDSSPFNQVHWNTQVSGIRIRDDVADALEEAWTALVDSHFTTVTTIDQDSGSFDTAPPPEQYTEGAARQIVSLVYERNRAARQLCIEHHGVTCVVCQFNFEAAYGEIGRGFIHVHHIHPLASRQGVRHVNPVTDLRPVCPNCHAMLHRHNPPIAIEELRTRISSMRGRNITLEDA